MHFFYFLLSSIWSHFCIYGSWRFCLSLCIFQLSSRVVLCVSLPSWLYGTVFYTFHPYLIYFPSYSYIFPLSSLLHPLFLLNCSLPQSWHLQNLWAPTALQPSPQPLTRLFFFIHSKFNPILTHSTSLSILLLLKPQCAPYCPWMFILQQLLKSKGPPRLTG